MSTWLAPSNALAKPPRARPAPNLIPVEEAHGAPPGFHLAQRPRYGAIIGGSITTGVGGMMLLTSLHQRATGTGGSGPGAGGELFMMTGGVAVTVGLPLLVYGLLSPRDVYVRDSIANFSVSLSANQQ